MTYESLNSYGCSSIVEAVEFNQKHRKAVTKMLVQLLVVICRGTRAVQRPQETSPVLQERHPLALN